MIKSVIKYIPLDEDKRNVVESLLRTVNGHNHIQRLKNVRTGEFMLRLKGEGTVILGWSKRWATEGPSIEAYNEIMREIAPSSGKIIRANDDDWEDDWEDDEMKLPNADWRESRPTPIADLISLKNKIMGQDKWEDEDDSESCEAAWSDEEEIDWDDEDQDEDWE